MCKIFLYFWLISLKKNPQKDLLPLSTSLTPVLLFQSHDLLEESHDAWIILMYFFTKQVSVLFVLLCQLIKPLVVFTWNLSTDPNPCPRSILHLINRPRFQLLSAFCTDFTSCTGFYVEPSALPALVFCFSTAVSSA